jgi:hypothetical protein
MQEQSTYLEYDPALDFWDQPRLLRGLISILSVSAIMIWVEVVFHRFLLLPEGNAAVKNAIRCAHEDLGKPISELSPEDRAKAFGDEMTFRMLNKLGQGIDDGALDGLYQVERDKVTGNNAYAYTSMLIPFFVVCFLIYKYYVALQQDRYRHHVLPIFGVEMEAVFASVLLSVVIFSFFQVVFFIYGQQFEYQSGAEIEAELGEYALGRLCGEKS